MVVAPTRALVAQWLIQLADAFGGHQVGVWYGNEKDPRRITATTYHSAFSILERQGERFGLLVLDEVHHLADTRDGNESTWLDPLRIAPAPHRLGLTATYPDDRDTGLEGLPGPVVFRRTIGEMADRELAEFVTERRSRPPDGAHRATEVRRELRRRRGERWPPVPGDEGAPYQASAETLGMTPDRVRELLFAHDPGVRILVRAPRLSPTALRGKDLANSFAEKLGAEREGWTLTREDVPVPVGGWIFLPDFTVRPRDGRMALVEIVGFWTPEYLDEKLRKLRQAGLHNLVVVAFRALAAGRDEGSQGRLARELSELPGDVTWFTNRARIGPVMAAVERVARRPAGG